MTAYAAQLDRMIAANPCALDAPDAATKTALVNLMVAATANVEAGLTSGTLIPRMFKRDPVITPMQQDDVTVAPEPGGNVSVENDSSLYLSTQITERATGRTVVRHVKGVYDLEMVGTQWGMLGGFNAQKKDYKAPSGRNAEVEVLTAGVLGMKPTAAAGRDAVFYLQIRTVIDKVVLPAIGAVIGKKVEEQLLYNLILSHAYDAIQDFRNLMNAGDVDAATAVIVNALLRDFEGVGPITTALAKLVAGAAPQFVAEVAARIGAKAVPVFGQVSAAVEALGTIATATNITKAVVDMGTTNQKLVFDVNFGFEVGAVRPAAIERAYRLTSMRVDGSGFRRVDPNTGERQVPNVRIIDRGGRLAPRVVQPRRVELEGTELDFDLPLRVSGDAAGPLEFILILGGEEKPVPNLVPISRGLTLTGAEPPTGGPGSRITLMGTGFGTYTSEVKVRFHSADAGVEATVLDVNRTTMEVLVPPTAVAGQELQIDVEVGRAPLSFTSERIPFNPSFSTLAGVWDIEITGIKPCIDPGMSVNITAYLNEYQWTPNQIPSWGQDADDHWEDDNARHALTASLSYNGPPGLIGAPPYGTVAITVGPIWFEGMGAYWAVPSLDRNSFRGRGWSTSSQNACVQYQGWGPPFIRGKRR